MGELYKIIQFQTQLIETTFIPEINMAIKCREDTIDVLGNKIADMRLEKTTPFFCMPAPKKVPNLARSSEEISVERRELLEKEMLEEMARLSVEPMGIQDEQKDVMIKRVSNR
eukprot:UN18950